MWPPRWWPPLPRRPEPPCAADPANGRSLIAIKGRHPADAPFFMPIMMCPHVKRGALRRRHTHLTFAEGPKNPAVSARNFFIHLKEEKEILGFGMI